MMNSIDLNGHSHSFNVQFRVNYKVDYGQAIAIIGNTDEMGAWKHFKHCLHWTEGDNWVIDMTLRQPYFMYKYVVVNYDTKEPIRWEEERNRIADLLLFEKGQKIIMNDMWEHYFVRFTIYYPL